MDSKYTTQVNEYRVLKDYYNNTCNWKDMAKRIVTRIGNVFCAEVEGGRKRYFQYICNDMCQLNSSVIRVFKTRYRMEDNPTIEEIVNDDVDFYAHTVLRPGIANGAWYKVGTSKNIGNGEHLDVLFATTDDIRCIDNFRIINVDPMKNWCINKINQYNKFIGILPNNNTHIEQGGVLPYVEIISRLTYGYYKYTDEAYDRIMRVPYPDIHSFLQRREDEHDEFYHFIGKNLKRVIKFIGKKYEKLTFEDTPELINQNSDYIGHDSCSSWSLFRFLSRLGGNKSYPSAKCKERRSVTRQRKLLYNLKFGDINWKNKEFISQEDFENAWDADIHTV